MKKRRWFDLAFVLFAVVFVVLLPVILPAIAILDALDTRRMRAAARKFACLSCGSYLGDEAIRLAEEAWRQDMSEKHANDPGLRLLRRSPRIVRHLFAICPRCGARYGYDHRKRTFVPLGKGQSGEVTEALARSQLRDVDFDREPYHAPVRDIEL
jgi:hypothetical protein